MPSATPALTGQAAPLSCWIPRFGDLDINCHINPADLEGTRRLRTVRQHWR
jgi:hypothetical protein